MGVKIKPVKMVKITYPRKLTLKNVLLYGIQNSHNSPGSKFVSPLYNYPTTVVG